MDFTATLLKCRAVSLRHAECHTHSPLTQLFDRETVWASDTTRFIDRCFLCYILLDSLYFIIFHVHLEQTMSICMFCEDLSLPCS